MPNSHGPYPENPFIATWTSRRGAITLALPVQSRRDRSRLEDYLEAIYLLSKSKGYVSTVDISDHLGVTPSTVSGMVSKLAKDGYLEHERYRGMKLTESGARLARSVIRRHETIEELLSMLGVNKKAAYEDAEGIEHHLQPVTIEKLERLVAFLRKNPGFLEEIGKERSER
jgi:Mn-dependent DtxR family transcriptional regulator